MNLALGVDVGGTFTDLCALGENGEVRVTKVATTHPDPADAPAGPRQRRRSSRRRAKPPS